MLKLYYIMEISMWEFSIVRAAKCYSSESESTGQDPSSTFARGSYNGELGSVHPATKSRLQRSPYE